MNNITMRSGLLNLSSCVFIVMLVFMLFSISNLNADEKDHSEKKPSSTTEKKLHQEPEQNRKKFEPAGKFTPTEKIRADDVVKFPVDI